MSESNVCVNSEMAGMTSLVRPIPVIKESFQLLCMCILL